MQEFYYENKPQFGVDEQIIGIDESQFKNNKNVGRLPIKDV